MVITETYKNNIKEIEKFLCTFNYPKESEDRIRKYIENPLNVLNDDIKALFEKYDSNVVDYRIQLPASMIRERKSTQKEIFLIMSLIVDCLEEDDQFKFTVDAEGNVKPDFQLTASTISNNFFKIKNDKRKVWRYLDSKVTSIAKRMYERWYDKKTFKWDSETETSREYIDLRSSTMRLGPFYNVFDNYIKTLGTRSTSLKTKITKFTGREALIDVTGKNHSEIINIIADEVLRPIFNIVQEIISAKMLDLEKYKLFLSFNVFDWLLASTGESWHSCIDMQSSYAYGTGLLGMCGCPDWGMLLYTDGTEKEFAGIKSYHIITRSWVCYTNKKDFQVINWYPKDVRSTVEFVGSDDFRFGFERCSSSRKSMSTWDPIVFENGAFAWIYSDSPRFTPTPENDKVYFKFDDACGLPRHIKINGKIYNDNNGAVDAVTRSITRRFSSIWDAVQNHYAIDVSEDSRDYYVCDCCGSRYENEDDLTYIESEDISVCSSCLDNNFYWCEDCESYHRYDGDSVEVHTGPSDWEYDLICNSCLDYGLSEGNIYWDDIDRHYYRGSEPVEVFNSDGSSSIVSPYTLENMVSEGRAFRYEDGTYHDHAEHAAEGAN